MQIESTSSEETIQITTIEELNQLDIRVGDIVDAALSKKPENQLINYGSILATKSELRNLALQLPIVIKKRSFCTSKSLGL